MDLERPDEAVLVDDQPVPPTQWCFPGLAEGQIEKLLAAAGLTPQQKAELADKNRWRSTTNGWCLQPPTTVLRTLSPSARRSIYTVLQRSPLNPFQHNPTRVPTAHFPDWLRTSGLPIDQQQLLRSLTYPEGETTCFADVPLVASECNVEERRELAKALTRTPSLIMKVRITADTDLDRLLHYWGAAGRGQTMKPLLQSLAHKPGGASVNVAVFFPAFARMRLYTYPSAPGGTTNATQDCTWTAMNFFNETPDDRYLKADFVRTTLQTDYRPAGTNRAFGDLVLLLANQRETLHLCVYVADDVVFTKNGMDPLDPWVLMRMSDLLLRYRTAKPADVIFLRRRSPGPTFPATGTG